MSKIRIKNPWHDPRNNCSKTHYEVNERPIKIVDGVKFYNLPASVLAVRDGVAVTECVTVRGAINRLKQEAEWAKEEEG